MLKRKGVLIPQISLCNASFSKVIHSFVIGSPEVVLFDLKMFFTPEIGSFHGGLEELKQDQLR